MNQAAVVERDGEIRGKIQRLRKILDRFDKVHSKVLDMEKGRGEV